MFFTLVCSENTKAVVAFECFEQSDCSIFFVEDATMTNGGGKKHGEQKSGQKGQTKDSKAKAKGGKS